MPEDRRLAAIMFTDIVVYIDLKGSDEDQIFWILHAFKKYENHFVKR